jgi:hypothetical protein
MSEPVVAGVAEVVADVVADAVVVAVVGGWLPPPPHAKNAPAGASATMSKA